MNYDSGESISGESGQEEIEEVSELEKIIGGGEDISSFFHLKEENLKFFKEISRLTSR